MLKKFNILALILSLITYPIALKAETITHDLSNWNRIGIVVEKDEMPLSLQIDGQLRLIKNMTTYDSFQIRNFVNYDFNKNNIFSIGYLFSTKVDEWSNVLALQYTNKVDLIKQLINYESRIRLEKRWITDKNHNISDDARVRLRIGLGYNLSKNTELIINNEFFLLDSLKFSENRMQTGLTYKFNDDITINLFYQNRYLPSENSPGKLDHTIFTNLLYRLKL